MVQSSCPSAKAKRSAARLAAVQLLYQSVVLKQAPSASLALNIETALLPKDELQNEALIEPDQALRDAILNAVEQGREMLVEALQRALKDRSFTTLEPLLQAILLAAASEIGFADYDAPIIINDYVDIAHAFYSGNEPGLVNGILQGLLGGIKV